MARVTACLFVLGSLVAAAIVAPAPYRAHAGDAPAATPLAAGASGRLAFSAEGDVYAVDADGTGLTRLTTDPADDFDPTWSPDGRQIAFRTTRDGNDEIYVMDADGSHQRNLTNDPADDWSPAWSPDGTRIAYAIFRYG